MILQNLIWLFKIYLIFLLVSLISDLGIIIRAYHYRCIKHVFKQIIFSVMVAVTPLYLIANIFNGICLQIQSKEYFIELFENSDI